LNGLNSLNPLNEEFEKEIPIHSVAAELSINNMKDLNELENLTTTTKFGKDIERVDYFDNKARNETQSNTNQVRIKNNDDFRFYEIDDEKGGKRLLKTVVIESSQKMKKIDRVESNLSKKDLKEFCWDNLEEYKIREAKKSQKGDDQNHKVG
jgi:hypothetical protein